MGRTKIAYIVHIKDHHDSQGNLAEWVVKSESGKILSSHSNKNDAEKHLYHDIEGHKNKKSSLEPDLSNNSESYKEISVFYRLCSDKDKPQMIDLVIKKFNVTEEFAEKIFNEVYPNGLKFIETDKTNIDTTEKTNIENKKKHIFANIEKVISNIKDFEITDEFIEDLYHTVENKSSLDSLIDKYKIIDDAFLLVLYILFEELLSVIVELPCPKGHGFLN
jgi:hypothetical protein